MGSDWVGTRGLILLISLAVMTVAVATESAMRNFLWARLQDRLGTGPRLERLKRQLSDERRLLDGIGAMRTIASYVFLLMALGVLAEDATQRDASAVLADLGLALLAMFAGVYGIVRGMARAAPERVLVLLLPLGRLLAALALPFAWISDIMGHAACRIFGLAVRDTEETARHDILDAVTEGEREGAIEEEAGAMIENIIEVQDQPVTRLMTPRTSVFAISVDATLADAAAAVIEHGHSRIPVYKGTIDNVVGIMLAKDLLRWWGTMEGPPGGLTTLLRAPLFVPETKLAKDLLAVLRRDRVHMAIVLDEYGGMSGVITVEDILEEIVGEIADEYDALSEREKSGVNMTGDHGADLEGTAQIDDVNKALDLSLPEHAGFDTIAGYVSAQLGRVPRLGEVCDIEGVRYEILDADARCIRRIRVSTSV